MNYCIISNRNRSRRSMMPRIESRKPALQYLHIPKAGTSVNWFLRDYFGSACASAFSSSSDRTAAVTEQQEEGNPCPEWLHTVRAIYKITI